MFSKQTADRFEKERVSEGPGPGSYDLPSTLENKSPLLHGAFLDGTERWQEASENGSPNVTPGANESFSRDEKVEASFARTPTPRHGEKENKENRIPAPPLSARSKGSLRSGSPRGPPQMSKTPSKKALPGPPASLVAAAPSDADVRRQKDLRLASQLDNVRDELKQKSKEAKELQLSLIAKDRKIEDLQKKSEELAAERREARRSAAEVESELGTKRRQIHDKDAEIAALQRKIENLRAGNEERGKRSDQREEELRALTSELQQTKSCLEAAAEQRAAAERDAKQAELGLRQQQKRLEELEGGLQSHIEVLEEQLSREVARRKDVEERQAAAGAERDQGETQLLDSQRRCAELEGKVSQLEEELKSRISAGLAKAQEQSQLEDELRKSRADVEAQSSATRRSEEQLQELQQRLSKAEGRLEAGAQELAAAEERRAELEEECQRFGAARCEQLHQKVQDAELRAEEFSKDLAEERARNEALEKQAAEFQDKERAARSEVEKHRQGREQDSSLRALESRALRAEAEAEEARQVLERWKEWGDEQQLRELSAETERLERLKQVREEVTSQVEEARKSLVEENRALHRRILELESGTGSTVEESAALKLKLEEQEKLREKAEVAAGEQSRQAAKSQAELQALQAEVDASLSRLDEQRLQLQRQCAEMEKRAKAAEEKLAQVEDQCVLEKQTLGDERKALEDERRARQSADERAERSEQALATARSRLATSRWQNVVEATLQRWTSSSFQELWSRATRAALDARGATAVRGEAAEKLQSQEAELERLDGECEELREQNQEVLLSLQLQQQDLQMALAESRRLSEREAAYESEMLRVSERSAELGGHTNPKQKIRHLQAVKEENQSLRQELKRSRQLATQLDSQLRTARFMDPALPSDSALGRSVSRPLSGLSVDRTPKSRGDVDSEKAELRSARAHWRALERSANAYQHLYMLVERALSAGDPTQKAEHFVIHSDLGTPAQGTANTAMSTTISMSATPARKCEEGGADLDQKDLYRRLRALSQTLWRK